MTAVQTAYGVSLDAGEDANGIAGILAALLRENLETFPSRSRIARRMRPVAVTATDTSGTATVVFGRDEAVVYNDVYGRPAVFVEGTVAEILDVSQLKVRAGGLLPLGFFTRRGMDVVGGIARRRLVVRGLLTHAITTLRFIALVSVAG